MFKQIHGAHQEGDESLDLLMQIWVRLILACVGLIIFIADPAESGLPIQYVYTLLVFYCLYSMCIALFFDTQTLLRKLASSRVSPWIDTIFFSCLMALTGGTDSVFFCYLFFPIFVASFSWGFRECLKITLASVALFVIAGVVSAIPSHGYELSEIALRPIYLLVFGYMAAHWGKGKIVLKQRLRLLQEISTNWNPRFGVDHAIGNSLCRLVEFFQGSQCIMILNRSVLSPKYVMYRTDVCQPFNSAAPKEVTETTTNELLTLPSTLAVAYESPAAHRMKYFSTRIAYDINAFESTDKYFGECKKLSSLFDDQSFISVPYLQQGAIGRIYLVADNKVFNRSDVAFVQQVADTLSSVVENMQLIEHLIAEAGEQERYRISLDVHDTTIQPYIGLTQALEALAREFKTNEDLTGRINEIIHMANMTIQDLRSYKDTLREKSLMRGDSLIAAVKNQAGRLLRFYGVQVEIRNAVDSNLSGRVAEAAFQIIKEGLSNILRHTSAKKAFVSIQSTDTHLQVEIGNEIGDNISVRDFKPKSICERVLSLQGETLIECNAGGYTVVRVTIPLALSTLLY